MNLGYTLLPCDFEVHTVFVMTPGSYGRQFLDGEIYHALYFYWLSEIMAVLLVAGIGWVF